jgi:pyridoxal phosphate enzyme (YggS family)
VIAAADVARRAAEVRARIRAAGGDPGGVRLVAATKELAPEAVLAALDAGLPDVGENYAQELLAKHAAIGARAADVTWHFLGRLQRNKVRTLAPVVALWHSVDRPSLAEEIARRAPGAAVLVQVNVSEEAQKGGCPPGDTAALVDATRAAGLDVVGLMAVGPDGPPEDARPGFRRLRRLADGLGLRECSMGMTHDLEVAVQEGATIVRVGRALFGARPGAAGA